MNEQNTSSVQTSNRPYEKELKCNLPALARWYSRAPDRRTTRTFPVRVVGIRLCATFLVNISPHSITTSESSGKPPGIFLHRTYDAGFIHSAESPTRSTVKEQNTRSQSDCPYGK